MKVLLLFPPRGFSSKEPLPPLGLLYLATVLKQNGIAVEVVDTAVEKFTWNDLKEKLLRTRPQVVGITSLTEYRFEAFRTAELAKKIVPEALVVMGGPHVSLTAEDTLRHVPGVDLVIRGEGEGSFLQLIRGLQEGRPLSEVRGLSFREDGRIRHNPPADLIKDLDRIPFPDRDLLPAKKYPFTLAVPGRGRLPAAHIITSRGCPFGCSFCATSQLAGRTWRARSPENVISEIEALIDRYQLRTIWFYDDTFNMNKARVERICELILEKKLDINFTCSIRVDLADRAFLQKMKAAGCFKVFYGVESGSQRVLDEVCGKKITLDQVRQVSRWLDEVGIIKNPGYIISFPGETREDARATMALIKEIGGEASLSLLRIYPGTKIEKFAKERNFLPPQFRWSCQEDSKNLTFKAAHGNSPIFLDQLSWDDLAAFSMEWADQQNIPLWKRLPQALRGIRSFQDLGRLLALGKNYLRQKSKSRERDSG